MLKQYPNDVKVVYKFFPLRSHKLARPAAIAAWSAGQQGKFWEMHDLIFANMSKLSEAKFKEFAQQIGLNMEQYEKDLKNPEANKKIQADLVNGSQSGVRGTPSIFVNGRSLKVRSLAGFQAIIDPLLKK